MFEEAGDIYSDLEMNEHAARCYRKAKKWLKAGIHFEMTGRYTDAISAYKNGKQLYEELIQLIEKYVYLKQFDIFTLIQLLTF